MATQHLALINFGAALLFIAVSIPLYRGRVPMNPWYGFRIPKSFESPRHWYLINRYGAARLILYSLFLLVFGGYALLAPFDVNDPFVWLFVFAPVIVLLLAVLDTFLYAQRLR